MKPLGSALLMVVTFLAGVGFCLGVLAAVLGLLLGTGVDGIADTVARIYLFGALALPAALGLGDWLALDQPDSRALYSSLPATLLAGVLGALLGGVAATLTFLLAGVNGPVLLGGLDANRFSAAVWSRIVWDNFALVVSVTLLAALPLGIWTHTRAQAVATRR